MLDTAGRDATGAVSHAVLEKPVRRASAAYGFDPHEAGGEPWTLDRIYEMFPALEARKNLNGRNLSGGEQQMLAIGRALMTNAGLILLDEATEGLAPLVCAEIWRCLERLKAVGQAILLIDSNHGALMQIADRHYIMEKGRITWKAASPGRPHHLDRRLGCPGGGGGRAAPVSGGLSQREGGSGT